jgi:hypothetical protein
MPPLTAANQIVRSGNVTASEVAALMPGGHPYMDAGDIYDRLNGRDSIKESQAMRIGSAMESSILRFAERELHFKARANARTLRHPTVRLCATPDAYLVGRWPNAVVAERALIEVKMSGREDMWREVPPYVMWQARAQMAVTDRDVVYIVVLVAMRLRTFAVVREGDTEHALLTAVQRFWTDNFAAGVRPEPAALVSPFSFDAA